VLREHVLKLVEETENMLCDRLCCFEQINCYLHVFQLLIFLHIAKLIMPQNAKTE